MDFVNLEISESRDDRRGIDQKGIDKYRQGPASFTPWEITRVSYGNGMPRGSGAPKIVFCNISIPV